MIILERLELTSFKSIGALDLRLPAAGAILVEGRNESGKSTLFEGIYFGLYGAPLVTEENKGSLENLISHGEARAALAVRLRTTERTLLIERTLRRGRASTARLTLEGGPEESERITGVRAVNARIIAELGGLDGAALLNSCFVEQKKLSKLEDLDARERRDSLLRILNLEKLSKLEDAYRVRAADEQRVLAARDRLRLATAAVETAGLRRLIVERRQAETEAARRLQRASMQSAETDLEEARNGVRMFAHLYELERAESERMAARPHDGVAPDVNVLQQRRARIVLAGVAGFSLLLLAGLLSLRMGATSPALVLFAVAVLIAVLTGYAFARLKSTIDGPAAGETHETVPAAGNRQEIHRLRAALDLRPSADVNTELGLAHQRLGARERTVEQARRSMESFVTADVYAVPGWNAAGESIDHPLREQEARLYDLEAEARHLSNLLNVDGNELDVGDCERGYAEANRGLEIKRRASVILTEARRRIVARVLPETETNMKLILPLLTAGRYHDACITEDYRISVWDSVAERYVGKNLFSGGTQDQFSLALRLAFAIASLPQEFGTAPGFLFMDEPLSSFDEERTVALIDLITRGQLARIFPQICIISHSQSFDPGLFPYVIEMDAGRIVHSNL